jgi:predicted CoA-binding protein
VQVESTERAGLISDFINRRVWAIVGASQDPIKFGYRVFRNLQQAGYQVFPVNARGGELLGVQVYPTLADLPQVPDVVDTVVPPTVTEGIVKEMHKLGLSRVWMQPGSESEEAIAYCRNHGIEVVYDACAMVHRRRWNEVNHR